jgi:hypothetical protein
LTTIDKYTGSDNQRRLSDQVLAITHQDTLGDTESACFTEEELWNVRRWRARNKLRQAHLARRRVSKEARTGLPLSRLQIASASKRLER